MPTIRAVQPPMRLMPPIGATAPKAPIPDRDKAYRLPLNTSVPIVKSAPDIPIRFEGKRLVSKPVTKIASAWYI